MKALFSFYALLAGAHSSGTALARVRLVRTPAKLTAALAGAQPADTITLKNGDWKDVALVVTKGGTPGNPLTPDDAGPVWLIARRQAGDLSLARPAPPVAPAAASPVRN